MFPEWEIFRQFSERRLNLPLSHFKHRYPTNVYTESIPTAIFYLPFCNMVHFELGRAQLWYLVNSNMQTKGTCGHYVAGFCQHYRGAQCHYKGQGSDPFVMHQDCIFCDVLTTDQKAQLVTPSYKLQNSVVVECKF